MGRQFLTPLQDASIYEQFENRNTGFDEILEVGKSRGASGSIRSLIQFDVTKFVGIPAVSISEASYFLNLRIANATEFQRNQTLEFFLVSGSGTASWDEGTGDFSQDLENPQDGVTWNVRNAVGAFWTESVGQEGGATQSLIITNSFDWEPEDIRIDISGQVRAWITGSPNNGLLIKIPAADEVEDTVKSNIRFFSRNTHTVYPPTLEAVFPTQTMSVGECPLNEAPAEFELFIPNMRRTFVTGSTNRIRFGLRSTQPIKTFNDTFRFSSKFFLPSASHLGVVDDATNAFIVPFDTGSLISADGTGSFFDLKIENMYINRTYKLLVKTEKPWGDEVIDTGHTFRVVLRSF